MNGSRVCLHLIERDGDTKFVKSMHHCGYVLDMRVPSKCVGSAKISANKGKASSAVGENYQTFSCVGP